MKTFLRILKTLIGSSVGAAVAVALYQLAVTFIVTHQVLSFSDIAIAGGFVGVSFGAIYTLAHWGKEPSIATSLALSAACVFCVAAISIHFGVFRGGFSAAPIGALLGLTVSVASGALGGTRLAFRSRKSATSKPSVAVA